MIEDFYVACTRHRAVYNNVNGRQIPTWYQKEINGYINYTNITTIVLTDKNTTENEYKFYTDEYDLKQGDKISYEGYMYEISGFSKNTAHKNHHCKAKLRRLGGVT